MENVVQFPRENAAIAAVREVFAPVEEYRNIAMSRTEREALENLGLRLGEIGATSTALLCLGLAARWKVAA